MIWISTETFSFLLLFADSGYQSWTSFYFAWRFLFWVILCTQSESSFKQTANLCSFSCLKGKNFKIKTFLETHALRKVSSRTNAAQMWFRRGQSPLCTARENQNWVDWRTAEIEKRHGCWAATDTLTSIPQKVQAQ